MRPSLRNPDELRAITITPGYLKHGEGSVLVAYGDTKVICTASLIHGVPRFLKGQNQGWLTAEYGMLPRSTNDRMDREAVKGKQGGRTLEIQRLIGRSLRNALNLTGMGEITITLDCDVIQADGGTRTASITGGCVALHLALLEFKKRRPQLAFPFKQWISAVSVGIYKNTPVLDLDYQEDSHAETDMNVVMNESGRFIEVQGTAEGQPFTQTELNSMLNLAQQGNQILIAKQKEAIAKFVR